MNIKLSLRLLIVFTILATSLFLSGKDNVASSQEKGGNISSGVSALFTTFFSLKNNPLYVTQSDRYHIVAKGETLYSISRRYSIPVDTLKLYNNLDSNEILVGQKIYLTPVVNAKSEYVTVRTIPESGYHVVLRGETVYRISKMYDLEIMDILTFNNLESFDIKAGQKIWLVPGKVETTITTDVAAPPDTVATTTPPGAEEAVEVKKPEGEYNYHIVRSGENLYRISLLYEMTVPQLKALNSLSSDEISVGRRLKVTGERRPTEEKPVAIQRPAAPTTTPHRKGSVYLPLNGKVLSEFGIRNNMPHNGIDIGATVGEPINATLDGKVVFAGVQRGYGNVVVLEHENFIMTVYAHNERNLVRMGDNVKKGQPIATVGQTGNASAPHLHFEYRIRGKAINPREVLPDF